MTDATLRIAPGSVLEETTEEDPRDPLVELLFHYDLARLGATTFPHTFSDGAEVVVGRTGPELCGPFDGKYRSALAQPLDDPCISRKHLSLRWIAGEQMFEVCRLEGSSLRVWASYIDAPRSERELNPGEAVRLRPRSLLRIADRIVLALDFRRPPDMRGGLHGLLGESVCAQALREQITGLAAAEPEQNVLICGETGTGKELVARALHRLSPQPRRDEPMVSVNIAELSESTAESELFGHRKGAFTGAVESRPGLFRAAGSGTVFLDEIGELSPALQPKLLRVLEAREVRPVGEDRVMGVEAHVVSATHRRLEEDVESGRFRADLFMRLSYLRLEVPSLDARREDIPRLFRFFLMQAIEAARAGGEQGVGRLWQRELTPHHPPIPLAYMMQLLSRPWPGNIRELRNQVAQLVHLNQGRGPFVWPEVRDERASDAGEGPQVEAAEPPETLSAEALSEAMRSQGWRVGEVAERFSMSTRQLLAAMTRLGVGVERETLVALLREQGFSAKKCARRLGVSPNTVYKWMEATGIPTAADHSPEHIASVLERHGGDERAAAEALLISVRALKNRLS